jgi:putative FmdB family regulatory protein
MPIYEYHCADCGVDFERLVRGKVRIVCPSCESRAVERRLSAPARPQGRGSGAALPTGSPSVGGCSGGGCGCH